jgi:hypothetical protein
MVKKYLSSTIYEFRIQDAIQYRDEHVIQI